MAQLKDTTISGGISVSGISNLAGSAQVSGGDLTLYTTSGDSPAIVFQRGILTDTYNDWRIRDSGGHLYFDQRGSGSTGWTNVGTWNSSSYRLISNGGFSSEITKGYYLTSGSYTGQLTAATLTANRTWTLPNDTGTIALTSQIPTDTNTTYTLTNALASHKFTWTFTSADPSGSTTTTAELAAGSNITLTDDTTNKKITIAATDTTYGIARYNTSGLVKPWYSHTVASTGPTAGSDSNAIAVNTISTTAGRYYAVEMDSEGRMFVNVPWASGSGGSNVTWNQLHTSGTQIASITIDNTTTDVYVQPLYGLSEDITPTQVRDALRIGRDICILHPSSLDGTNIELQFTAWNNAHDTIYGGQAMDIVISQTIARYGSVYWLYELIGYIKYNGNDPSNNWDLFSVQLVQSSDLPSLASSSATGITASTTANTTTVGSHSTDYGVKSAGSGSFIPGAFFGGSFTQGVDSFTPNIPTVIDTTKFNGGSYSHTGFSGGSGSFVPGSFNGGSGSFSATVDSHVLSFSHTHTAATHGADSHTHTAATYGTDSFTAASLSSGFYSAGTAASFTQGEDTFSPATHGADSHTHTAPTLGSKVPTVSTANATVTITDPGHNHSLT